MAKRNQAPKEGAVSQITLTWGNPKDVPLLFAENLHWRTLPDRCYVTFGQLELPLLEGPLPDGTIGVQPVVRLVATPATIKTWAILLAQAAAEYEKMEAK